MSKLTSAEDKRQATREFERKVQGVQQSFRLIGTLGVENQSESFDLMHLNRLKRSQILRDYLKKDETVKAAADSNPDKLCKLEEMVHQQSDMLMQQAAMIKQQTEMLATLMSILSSQQLTPLSNPTSTTPMADAIHRLGIHSGNAAVGEMSEGRSSVKFTVVSGLTK